MLRLGPLQWTAGGTLDSLAPITPHTFHLATLRIFLLSTLVLGQISLRVREAFQSSYSGLMSERKQTIKKLQLTKCMRLRITVVKSIMQSQEADTGKY